MRFVLGLLLGFGVGFAGAILFAPEKGKRTEWPPLVPEEKKQTNHHDERSVGSLMATVRERIDEAMKEARAAKKKAEREMLERYERSVGRKSDK